MSQGGENESGMKRLKLASVPRDPRGRENNGIPEQKQL